ncbi:MAG TPA: carboxypeptidase-like regulatory domain-containing protein [Gemmata sp.]|nr:carboxypeptidase-like regulatory domain-containing protein [Gemmata sp.]
MTCRGFAAVLLASILAGGTLAQEPKYPDAKTFDKLVDASLRDVHNRAAEIFNNKQDYQGAYRMFQGALLTVHPLLAHHPRAQKMIDKGLQEAETIPTMSDKAHRLHEVIFELRDYLKDPEGLNKKKTEPKPKEKSGKVGMGGGGKGGGAGTVTGLVTFNGKALPDAGITLVTLDEAKPRVFTGTTQADGSYSIKEQLPAGRYAVIVTAPTIPAKYQTTTTSGLTIEVKPGANVHNIDLK